MNAIISIVKNSINDFVSLLYPNFCPGCKDVLEAREAVICTSCRVNLPRTQFTHNSENQIEKLFWGKIKLEKASAFLQFHNSSLVKNLLHALKYEGAEDVGEVLGKMFAVEKAETGFFDGIDIIVPVPLHIKRMRERGYNQCSSICLGISKITGIKVAYKGLVRNRATESQTKKTRFERWENTKDLFSVNSKKLSNLHVLLVDDVVTTGSTLEACANALISSGNAVSILAMACPID